MSSNKGRFKTGLLIGFILSIISSVLTIWVQHLFTIEEKTVQLYLNEKEDFVNACDNYLKEYRQWYELMNYFVYKDTMSKELVKFENRKSALKAYHNWRKEIDLAYGKIFILSDNDFGFKTLKVSTVLHYSLKDLILNSYTLNTKKTKFKKVNSYFYDNWLLRAQKEIFRYNTGERRQKSMQEFINEQKMKRREQKKEDSIINNMYKGLSRLRQNVKENDSNNLERYKSRMPTKEEFKRFINPEKRNDR